MRILHILDHGLPLHSGYTFRTRAILKAQMARGWDVAAVTSPRHGKFDTDEETIDGIRFYRTPRVNSGPPVIGELREVAAFARRIEAVARHWRPDVLHAHSPVLGAMAAQRVADKLGLPLVYEIRAFWEDAAVGNGTGTEGSWKYRATRWLETRAVRKADAVAVICEGLKNDLVARGGIDPGKIMISPNGVDLGVFGEPLPYDRALAKELGIDGAETIGFIGSFYDYEGLDVLIEAMPALVAARPKMHLVLVGGGPCDPALTAQAAASPVADRIHFVGRVPHQQVERYYSVIDVLVYPRKHMRLTDLVTPLKPLEAMAQRRLVAASDVGGHRELIRDGDTGTLFKPDDPMALAQAVARLFAERDGWDARRERGRAFVEAERNWARNVGRYDSVYQRLAKVGAMEDSWSHTPMVSA
ncbi:MULTISPECIES: TIGR04063 family PEP-CTERM/XrtA system glycosyltransferase [unclassified Sphingomonas]|uniref:TIGR04063 family PEP-CTERM/XrtA system glycosyltransferase n=1 Tax=Sphingomonas TaxID=13687 RepID=UPI00095DC6D5|nr:MULTISPECIES: TIGR04063 family PEP-CTERM/XrtA system glycosyltransferase [unclassified Sphingomonas]MBN8812458.1 glycosyltransferase, exosortase A system-associated [Sphingomonas sp.]OJY52212.1 MAG: glycosyltransferase, exosortase A system-associated [Sphingomonas sp. 67-41]